VTRRPRGDRLSFGPRCDVHDRGFVSRARLAVIGEGREFGTLLLAGFAFGLVMAAIKGQDAGVRDAMGNMSAPWVLLPFLAGTRSRILSSASAGVGITPAAFLGFYLAEAAILDLGPHPWYTDLRLTLGSGHIYEAWGLATGALYGALGGLWRARSLLAAPVAVAFAFAGEPLVVWVVQRAGLWGGGGLLDYRWLWITEVTVGVAAMCCVLRGASSRSGRAS
jgi:hypothetical protein